MTPSKLSQSILAKIEEKHIEPTPKWNFIIRNILWWALFGLSILLGGAGLAVMIFAISHQRFDYVDLFQHGGPSVWLGMLPFFWVLFFVGFIWVSFWGIAHTKKAYRIPRFLLIFINVVLTLLWGSVVYSSGLTERFERRIVEHVPFMKTIREQRVHRWEDVDHGFLSGKVQSLSEKELTIKTRSERVFVVDIEQAILRGGAVVQESDMVRFTGERQGDNSFKAETYGVFDPEKIRDRVRNRERGMGPKGDNPERRQDRFKKGDINKNPKNEFRIERNDNQDL